MVDDALAQQKTIKDQLVGTWALIAVTAERADGSKGEPFGPNPKGTIIFTGGTAISRWCNCTTHAEDRGQRSCQERRAEEAQAIVDEIELAYYGTYTVNEAEKTIAPKLEGGTYANIVGGPEQKRIGHKALTANSMKFTNPRTPAGVTLLTVWKRAPAAVSRTIRRQS